MRGIVVVCVGASLALAADHAYAESSNKQAETQNSISASLQNLAASYSQEAKRAQSTVEENSKCGQEKYESNADLCAQWKAADAAANSAWWAWLSGIVGIGGLAGVVGALFIALHSNRIARNTANRQLRAYLGIAGVWLNKGEDVLFFRLQNYGQTPAQDAKVEFDIIAGPGSMLAEPVLRYGQVDPATKWLGAIQLRAKPYFGDDVSVAVAVTFKITYRDITHAKDSKEFRERSQTFRVEPKYVRISDDKDRIYLHLAAGTSRETDR